MSKRNAKDNSLDSISRRDFLKLAGGGAAVLMAGGFGDGNIFAAENAVKNVQKAARPKNIVLIITDQQHIDTLSSGGCGYVKTPAMDKLKVRGLSFRQSYTPNPVCSPARSSIFTGRCSSETGVYTNGKSIREDIPNIGQWFGKETDYETIYAGKWHLPADFTLDIPGFKVLTSGIPGVGYVSDTVVSRACEGYIRGRSGSSKPLLMVVNFLQPHDICEWLRINTKNPDRLAYPEIAGELPELPDNFNFDPNEPEKVRQLRPQREPLIGKWNERQWRYYLWSYYRNIEMVDAEIGRILEAIEECGEDKDTLIVLTSDHGEGLGSHQTVRKDTLYDESAKVPFLISWPGHISENKNDTKHLVSGLDIMPTLCDYAGVKSPPDMRGRSLRPILEGKSIVWHDFIVSEVLSNSGRMVRTERYKYICFNNDPVAQLFDMQEDPGETKNLAADSRYADKVAEHRRLLKDWEARLNVAADIPQRDAWWYKSEKPA
jgi:choline-sulfatase